MHTANTWKENDGTDTRIPAATSRKTVQQLRMSHLHTASHLHTTSRLHAASHSHTKPHLHIALDLHTASDLHTALHTLETSRPYLRTSTTSLELPDASRASYYLDNSLQAAFRASCHLQSFVLAASELLTTSRASCRLQSFVLTTSKPSTSSEASETSSRPSDLLHTSIPPPQTQSSGKREVHAPR